MSENTHIIDNGPDAAEIEEMVMGCVKHAALGDDDGGFDPPLTRGTRLIEDLGFDELDVVELIIEVEEKLNDMSDYGVIIPEDMSDGVVTVGDLIEAAQRCARRVG